MYLSLNCGVTMATIVPNTVILNTNLLLFFRTDLNFGQSSAASKMQSDSCTLDRCT